jgi:hypothetical protein
MFARFERVRTNIEMSDEVRTIITEVDGEFGDETMLREVLEGRM